MRANGKKTVCCVAGFYSISSRVHLDYAIGRIAFSTSTRRLRDRDCKNKRTNTYSSDKVSDLFEILSFVKDEDSGKKKEWNPLLLLADFVRYFFFVNLFEREMEIKKRPTEGEGEWYTFFCDGKWSLNNKPICSKNWMQHTLWFLSHGNSSFVCAIIYAINCLFHTRFHSCVMPHRVFS